MPSNTSSSFVIARLWDIENMIMLNLQAQAESAL